MKTPSKLGGQKLTLVNGLIYNFCNTSIITRHLIKNLTQYLICLLDLTHHIYFLLGDVLLLKHCRNCILNHYS
jgi:hypothetical protein